MGIRLQRLIRIIPFCRRSRSVSLMDIAHRRSDYTLARLTLEELDPDPFVQFARWMDDACNCGLVEPTAMSLASVSANGQPSLRTVLLKGFSAQGFVFFTNLESRKARDISDNPKVSLLFPWLQLQRQVSIAGTAERISAREALAYFISRPFASQLAAWASPQSQVISTRAILEGKWEEMKRKFAEGKVPMPSFWGGYRVKPNEIEFWQGREHRLHDRFLYSSQPDGKWQINRLAP